MSTVAPELIQSVTRLSKDLREAAETMGREEIRFLVDSYYAIQKTRIRSDQQMASLSDNQEPHSVLTWLADQSRLLENQVKAALQRYAKASEVGAWMLDEVVGIGPVLASGFLAHIDIHQAPTVGHIWRFAGLDPTREWNKKQKRPWNAQLKTLCYKAGESFVKVQHHDNDVYGKHFARRKVSEWENNEAGKFSEVALLKAPAVKKSTDAYKWYSGMVKAGDANSLRLGLVEWKEIKLGDGIPMLPPAHIHARARRWAVKLFLAHLHEMMFKAEFKKDPPLPYPIEHLGHVHKITP